MEGLSLARPDWEERIRALQSLIPDGVKDVNPALSARAVGIFNKLRIPDIPGTPSFGEVGGEWLREIIGGFLGSISPITGERLVRELFLMVPKKTGKTTSSAGLMLTALLMNTRPRAKFLLTGPTQEVSDLAFDQACGMIEKDPEGFLQKRMHVQTHLKTITDRRTKAELRVKTFDMSVAVGSIPAGVLFDELHVISKNSQASRVIGQLRGGMISNPEAFLAFITTQSDEPPAGAFKAELALARAIRDGRVDGRTLPVLYEFPKAIMEDRGKPPAWENPENWRMVTPNDGRSITIRRLVEDFDAAKQKGPEEVRRWLSQHVNLELGLGLKTDRWVGADYWEDCANPSLTLDGILDRCDLIVIGVDGGGLDDLLGLSVLGRDKHNPRLWLHWCHAWAHKSVFERRKDIAERLRDFAHDGDLTVVENVSDDVKDVADLVQRIDDTGFLPNKNAIGADQVGIGDIVDELTVERGMPIERIAGVKQGWEMTNAIKDCERKLAGKEFEHCGQPLMAWNVGNAKVEPRGNAITITKQNAGNAKIDTLMSLFDAAKVLRANSAIPSSVYEERGPLFL